VVVFTTRGKFKSGVCVCVGGGGEAHNRNLDRGKTLNTCRDSRSQDLKIKLNSVALVRKETKPTKRPPLVGEVSADFCG
jgi:hypothetical protein